MILIPLSSRGGYKADLLTSKIKMGMLRIIILTCPDLGRDKKIHEMKRCLRQRGDFVPEKHLGPFPGKAG